LDFILANPVWQSPGYGAHTWIVDRDVTLAVKRAMTSLSLSGFFLTPIKLIPPIPYMVMLGPVCWSRCLLIYYDPCDLRSDCVTGEEQEKSSIKQHRERLGRASLLLILRCFEH